MIKLILIILILYTGIMEQNEAYKSLAAKINNLSNGYEQTGKEERGEGTN